MKTVERLNTTNAPTDSSPVSWSPQPLLTIKEVAAITRLSRSQVYNLINRGVLPSVQLPGCSRVLVDVVDLRAYLDAGRRKGTVTTVSGQEVRTNREAEV